MQRRSLRLHSRQRLRKQRLRKRLHSRRLHKRLHSRRLRKRLHSRQRRTRRRRWCQLRLQLLQREPSKQRWQERGRPKQRAAKRSWSCSSILPLIGNTTRKGHRQMVELERASGFILPFSAPNHGKNVALLTQCGESANALICVLRKDYCKNPKGCRFSGLPRPPFALPLQCRTPKAGDLHRQTAGVSPAPLGRPSESRLSGPAQGQARLCF